MPDLSDYKFTATHEWVRTADGVATIGITDYAQAQLGDVIFLELPEVGKSMEAGEKFGVVESVKAASDLYLPVGGVVTEVNTALADAPEAINTDPFEGGWMLRLGEISEGSVELLDEAGYTGLTGGH